MRNDTRAEGIRQRYSTLSDCLNEAQRRRWAASEAKAAGYGGVSLVARISGLARSTIRIGLSELDSPLPTPRIRRHGAGRKSCTHHQPDLLAALDSLVEPASRGDPESSLRWTIKSTRRLATELQEQGFQVSYQRVAELLRGLGYSLQANCKTVEGNQHPDRNAQFEFIEAAVEQQQRRGQPVISVDTKKKELVGNYRNSGDQWCLKGDPVEVQVHDFADKLLGKAIPYGVYDLTANTGWVSIGVDHDTAAFATATISRWWRCMGQPCYPRAKELLITADGGGSNASRSRLWQVEVQKLADLLQMTVRVCHFPPGTSKWNKIEHRLFSHISINWRGQPLTSLDLIVRLIGATTTTTGLRVRAAIDRCRYPKGLKVTKEMLATIQCQRESFHGEWNYRITPRT